MSLFINKVAGRGSGTGAFLRIYRTPPGDCFWRKMSRLLITGKSVNFGINSIKLRGSLSQNNLPLRLKNSQTIDEFKS